MNRFFTICIIFLLSLGGASGQGRQAGRGAQDDDVARALPVLTHADAAVILAKYAGFFDRYVASDASVNDCVMFLNRTGVYIGLMEVIDGKEFTISDFARSLGQITLVLEGEAEYEGGKVKLPKEIASWEDFCTINGVEFAVAFRSMQDSFYSLVGEGE